MAINSFRDLRVWQASMKLVEDVYRITESFPSKVIYALTNQIRRAAVSVPSNIAEGHTRESTKEYLNHLSIAQAPLAELETQIEISERLGYVTRLQIEQLLADASILGKQLFALRNALQKKLN